MHKESPASVRMTTKYETGGVSQCVSYVILECKNVLAQREVGVPAYPELLHNLKEAAARQPLNLIANGVINLGGLLRPGNRVH